MDIEIPGVFINGNRTVFKRCSSFYCFFCVILNVVKNLNTFSL